MELEEIMKDIRIGDEIHLEERARLLIEIGGFGLGGIELPFISKHAEEVSPEIAGQWALERSIRSLWSDACICYVQRRF